MTRSVRLAKKAMSAGYMLFNAPYADSPRWRLVPKNPTYIYTTYPVFDWNEVRYFYTLNDLEAFLKLLQAF